MARPRSNNLPTYMLMREGKKQDTYWYTKSKPWIKIGHTYEDAILKWSELEAGKIHTTQTIGSGCLIDTLKEEYFKHVVPTKSKGSQKNNNIEWKQLNNVFSGMILEEIEPHMINKYLQNRSGKVCANREKALLSHMFNYARSMGFTNAPNPCTGISKNPENGRSILVTDQQYTDVWNVAKPQMQDMMDLLLYTGQRPADVLKMTRDHIYDGCLNIHDFNDGNIEGGQNKTGAKISIQITGEFEKIMDRILNRPRKKINFYLVANDHGHGLGYSTIKDNFTQARKLIVPRATWQMRDLRAKNATEADNIKLAQERLGHSTPQMTKDYLRGRKSVVVPPLK